MAVETAGVPLIPVTAKGLEGSGSLADLALGVLALVAVLGGALYLGKRFDRLF